MKDEIDEAKDQVDRSKGKDPAPIFDNAERTLTDPLSNDLDYMVSVLDDFIYDLKGLLVSIDTYKNSLDKAIRKK